MKKSKRKFYSIFHKYVTMVHPDNPIAERGIAHNYRQRSRCSKICKRMDKRLIEVEDSITGTKTGHIFMDPDYPDIRISIG